MRVIRLSNVDLGRIQYDWDQLNTSGVPFRSWGWLSAWWTHFGPQLPNTELYTLGVFDDQQQLLGLAPWYLQSTDRGRVIRSLGTTADENSACHNTPSTHLSTLYSPGYEQAVASALARKLLFSQSGSWSPDTRTDLLHGTDGLPDWDMIELSDHDPDDILAQELSELLRDRGVAQSRTSETQSWQLQTGIDADFFDTLPAISCNETRLLYENHVQSKNVRLRFTGPEQLQAVGGPCDQPCGQHCTHDCRTSDPEQNFRAGLIPQENKNGLLFNAKVVDRTGQLGMAQLLESGETLYVYGLTPDHRVELGDLYGLSDTQLCEARDLIVALGVLDWAQESGYRRVELLFGSEEFKKGLGAAPCENVTIRMTGRWHADQAHEKAFRPHGARQHASFLD